MTPTSASAPLQASTFEDDGTFALPPGETFKTTTPQQPPQQPQQSTSTPGSGAGAQILLNRFSTWKQRAGDNANVLWKQAKEAQEKAAATNQGPLAVLRQAAGVTTNRSRGRSGNDHDDDDDDDEEEESSSRSHSGGSSSSEDDESETDEDPHAHHDNDEDDGAPTSVRSLPNLPTRKEMRTRVSHLATGALDAVVATGFIGRYANAPAEPPTSPTTTGAPLSPHSAAKESQTSLILKSRAAGHLQDILDSLEAYQYVLLLGAGRLQVNLKNPYVPHQGTYVDYLVQGGAADKSGIVAVGDAIVKVGAQTVVKQTIADVPNIIAQAKRPVVLVLTTGVEVEVERITYLDVAVAMMHQIRAKDEAQKQAMIASAHKHATNSSEPSDDTTAGHAAQDEDQTEETTTDESKTNDGDDAPSSSDGPKEEPPKSDNHEATAFENIVIPVIRSIHDYASPPQPPMEARRAYQHLVGKRYVQ